MKKTVKTLVESNTATKRAAFRTALVEMMGMEPGLGDVPVEVASEEMSSEDQIDAAFRAVMVSILDDETLDDASKLTKLKDVLKAKTDAVAAVGGETPSESEAAMEESLKTLTAENATLKEEVQKYKADATKAEAVAKVTKQLIESKRAVTDLRVKTLLAIESDTERTELIEQWSPVGESTKLPPKTSPSKFSESEVGTAPKDYEAFKRILA